MNSKQLLEWMQKPGLTGREDGAQLDALLQTYPYFQTAHLLYIKNLHNQGSFLYNNQLKSAAIYVADRKVLYDLIKRKDIEEKTETVVVAQEETPTEQVTVIEEKIVSPVKFPEKRFVSNPDEWEAGMLRQLQLLHHWRGKEKEEVKPKEEIQPIINEVKINEVKPVESSEEIPVVPDAKDELNTLLYVLVEPGQSEDIGDAVVEETDIESEVSQEETKWEVHELESAATEEELKPEVEVPQDPIQQEILVEAINSVFELEAEDTLPDISDLKVVPQVTEVVEKVESPADPVADIGQLSFSAWLNSLKQVEKSESKSEVPEVEVHQQTSASGEDLIERFIKEEPRIQVKKSGFFNPVNMAKKSVQDSDEFITETLARIYAKQGNIPKAIRSYQKLSLKFPEKTAYFAALIEELKRTPNK